MVVDGAIRFARQGAAALQEGRWELMGQALGRSRSCVSELIGGLNSQEAPELAAQLGALFVFIYRSLTIAELEQSPQRIDDALRILELHRETWIELGLKIRSEYAGASTPIAAPHSRSWTT